MKIRFIKMHAQGNDFVILKSDEVALESQNLSDLAIEICDRHFGLGADGLVWLDMQKPEMLIYNSDGSRAEMCGSALRCCCYLLAEKSGNSEIGIYTYNGLAHGIVDKENPFYVTVEIGKPELIEADLILEGFTGSYIDVGNPHFVVYLDNLSNQPHMVNGKALSENSYFKEGANVEFARINSRKDIEIVIWERGAGATLACGTGSTAVVFTGHFHDWLDDEVTVHVPGGIVQIIKKDDTYQLGGEVSFVASGEYIWKT